MNSKGIAVLLAWLFWPALDFYLGEPGKGIFKIITLGGLGIWAIVDAVRLTLMSETDFDVAYNG